MRTILAASLAVCLTACGGVPVPPSSLVPPAKRCMVSPGQLQALRAGEDLVPAYATTIRSYKRETSKLRCLQKWVRAVSSK